MLDEWRADPALSDARIDAAPEPLKALFREYELGAVLDALSMVGLNDDPAKFSEAFIASGAEDARKILDADRRRRFEEMTRGR